MSESNPPLGHQPSRMPAADLGGVFGGSDRARGLAGRLAPVAPRPEPPPAPPVDPEPPATDEPSTTIVEPAAVAPPAKAPVPAVRRRPRTEPQPKPPRQPPAVAGGERKTVVVYVRASIRDRLRAATAGHPALTHTDLVLAALDATHAQLQTRFRSTQDGSESASLFSGRPGRRRLRHEEPQVQLSIRPWVDDLEVIDRLVGDTGAPNRSALVDTALDIHLAGPA